MSSIRPLKASEVMLRQTKCNSKMVKLCCYKKDFVDERILEETFGYTGFQVVPSYNKEGVLGCVITVHEKGEFLGRTAFAYPKETEGAEKNPIKCTGYHLGIGTELYTAPDITFWPNEVKLQYKDEADGKWKEFTGREENASKLELHCFDTFKVEEMNVAELDGVKTIVKIVVANTSTGIKKTWISETGVHDLNGPSMVMDEKNATVKVSEEMKQPVQPAETPKEKPTETPKEETPATPEERYADADFGDENDITVTAYVPVEKEESNTEKVEKASKTIKPQAKEKPISQSQLKTIERNMKEKNISLEMLKEKFGFTCELAELTLKQASPIVGGIIKM